MKKILIAGLMLVAGTSYAQQDCSPVVEAIQNSISRSMKDPESIKLRDIKLYQFKDEKDRDAYIATGEINGKNIYGGYVGFSPFAIHVLYTPKGPFAFAHVIANSPSNSRVMDQVFTSKISSATLVCQQ